MARFDRYLLQQLMLVFGFFSFVLVMIYWINRAVRLFDQLIADGQSAGVFLEFTALSLPAVIVIAVPLAAFVASVYATNRLSQDSELVVMQATGFSPYRMARPVAYFGVIVFLLLTVLIHVLAPLAYAKLQTRTAEISQDMTARLLTAGTFIEPADGFTVYIRDITPEGELRDIFLSDTRDPEAQVTYTASSAFFVRSNEDAQIVMVDGMVQTLRSSDNRLFVTAFDDFALNFAGVLDPVQSATRNFRMVPTPELFRATPQLEAETQRPRSYLIGIAHGRIADSLLGFVAAMLGFSALLVGGFSRFGVWRQIVLAVVLIIIIKAVETTGVNIARSDANLWFAAYLHVVLGLVFVAGLLFISGRPYLFKRAPSLEVSQ